MTYKFIKDIDSKYDGLELVLGKRMLCYDTFVCAFVFG